MNEPIIIPYQSDEDLTYFLKQQISQGLKIPLELIDVEQPLIEIGADSLGLMSMINTIQSKYKINISMIQLFEEVTTIAELVKYIKINLELKGFMAGAAKKVPHKL